MSESVDSLTMNDVCSEERSNNVGVMKGDEGE